MDPLILAPSNSPLQYPLHGFKVAPLQQSTIPGKMFYHVNYSKSTARLKCENAHFPRFGFARAKKASV